MPCSSLNVASNLPLSNSFCIAAISPSRASCIMSSSIGRLGFLSAMSSSSCSPVACAACSGGVAAEAISGVRVGCERHEVLEPHKCRASDVKCMRLGYRDICILKIGLTCPALGLRGKQASQQARKMRRSHMSKATNAFQHILDPCTFHTDISGAAA
jgi:hypothetical protein